MGRKKAKIVKSKTMEEMQTYGHKLSNTEIEWINKMAENASNGKFLCHNAGKQGCEICHKIFPELKLEMERLKTGRLCPCDIISFDGIFSKDLKEIKKSAETYRKDKK